MEMVLIVNKFLLVINASCWCPVKNPFVIHNQREVVSPHVIDRVERPTEYRQKEYPDQEVVRGSEYPGFVVERQKENRYSRGNTEVLQGQTLDFC